MKTAYVVYKKLRIWYLRLFQKLKEFNKSVSNFLSISTKDILNIFIINKNFKKTLSS